MIEKINYRKEAHKLILKHTLFLGTIDDGDEVWTTSLDALTHAALSVKAIIDDLNLVPIFEDNGSVYLEYRIKYWGKILDQLIDITEELHWSYEG